ncbi:TetR/AcrR family transcriptional regulator [Acinetobacter soli]|uniref:TetR/AcrR family transcriptional regulator n=1 Tax=Acinetobacter soli TaxID=487316 RepID=UPI00287F8AF2|nr:helix-turn-helix domain-containing protein [Acinetobacter soli]
MWTFNFDHFFFNFIKVEKPVTTDHPKEKSRGPSRPKDKSKEIVILTAARKLFLEIGLDVTTDAIALDAGVAKSTIYPYFSDKECLLEGVIRLESYLTISDEQFEKSFGLPLYDVLKSFGLRYVKFINNREILRWGRPIASAVITPPKTYLNVFYSKTWSYTINADGTINPSDS